MKIRSVTKVSYIGAENVNYETEKDALRSFLYDIKSIINRSYTSCEEIHERIMKVFKKYGFEDSKWAQRLIYFILVYVI